MMGTAAAGTAGAGQVVVDGDRGGKVFGALRHVPEVSRKLLPSHELRYSRRHNGLDGRQPESGSHKSVHFL